MPLPRGRERASLRVRAGLHRVSLREGGHLLPARRPGPDRHHLLDRRHRHPHHPRRLRLPLQSPLSEAAEEEKGGRAGDLEQEFAFQKRGRAGDGHCVTEFQVPAGGSRMAAPAGSTGKKQRLE